jgi:(2Fe-2S) ferredoxin
MSYYAHHVFFCTNQRDADAPRPCCATKDASAMRDYAKKKIKAAGLAAPGKVRVNNAGCLERCEEGPCLVVYPEAVWYTYVDQHDIDEIVESHLQGGKVVERLMLPPLAA